MKHNTYVENHARYDVHGNLVEVPHEYVEGMFGMEVRGNHISFPKVHQFDEPMDEIAFNRVKNEVNNSAEFSRILADVFNTKSAGVTFNQILDEAAAIWEERFNE